MVHFKKEDVNCLVEAYKQERDQFMENTNVLKLTLAQKAFDDNHTSFSSFNVVILITLFFPKRLTAKLQQLAVTNVAMFQQQDVREVTVAGMVCIQATQLQ